MKQSAIRVGLLVLGLTFISMGVAVFSKAALGFDPFMIFDSGLSKTLGLSLGVTHISINLALLLLYLLIGKKRYINVGTILALTITGPMIDLFSGFLRNAVPGDTAFTARFVMAALACPLVGLGVYLYTGMRLGAGPNDLVAVILSDVTKKPFGIVRMLVDGMWTLAGVLLGGSIGIGSIVAVVLVGASVQIYIKIKLFSGYVVSDVNKSRH